MNSTVFLKKAVSRWTLFCLLACLPFLAQAQDYQLNVSNEPIATVIGKIQQMGDYTFAYNSSQVDLNQKISVNVKDADLRTLLDKVFSATGISYKIVDKRIILSSDSRVAAAQSVQEKNITGVVLQASDDEPIPGAAVKVVGGNAYAITDEQGNFELKAKEGDVLEVISMGLKTCTVEVGSASRYVVKMDSDVIALDDVVVTGFQTLSKERSTGAFVKLGEKELAAYNTPNIATRLETAMSGVMVKSDGEIEIRGLSTLNTSGGKSQPLLVIDGFPVESGLSSLNPNDIENITILRDAAAASIYGIKSANGVIVVTTKGGDRNEKFKIDVRVDYSLSKKPSLDYLDLMDARQAVDFQWEALERGGFDRFLDRPDGYYSELAKIYRDYSLSQDASLLLRKDELASFGRLSQRQYEDMLLRRNTVGQYGISISGGSKKANYYVSGRFEDHDSMYKGKGNNKFFLDSKLSMDLAKNFTIDLGLNVNFSDGTQNNPMTFSRYRARVIPFEPLVENGEYYPLSAFSTPYALRDKAKELGLLPAAIEYNPVRDMKYLNNSSNSFYNRYQVGLRYKFDFGLGIDVKYQFETGRSDHENISSPETYAQANIINRYVQGSSSEDLIYNIARDKSGFTGDNDKWKSHMVRGVVNYAENLAENVYLSALAGVELQATTNNYIHERYSSYDPVVGVLFPDITKLQSGFKNWTGVGRTYFDLGEHFAFKEYSTDQRSFSTFFNAGLTFFNKYNLTGSFRIDQSNIFGTDTENRYKPMWSVGASWNINKESFMTDVDWINNLSLRATYGLTGMIDKSTSPYIIIQKDMDSYLGAGVDFAGFPNAPNKDLRWEETKNLNIGVDFSFLNNRLGGSIDYYNKYTSDVIAPKENDPTNGFDLIVANTAEISNKGVDVSLNSVNFDSDFKWTTTLNFSYNKNKIEKLYADSGLDAYYFVAGTYMAQEYLEGSPIDQMYSYNWKGLNEKGNAVIYDGKGNSVNSTDGSVNLFKEDLIYSGCTQAPFFGNFTNNFGFKGFTLSLSMTYKLGYYSRKYRFESYAYESEYDSFYADRWKKPGDEAHTNIPSLDEDGIHLNSRYFTYGSANVFNASHIRLKYINLSYSLPSKVMKKIGFRGIDFSIQAENLGFVWRADKSGIDPDVHSVEAVRNMLPNPATFTFGVNLKL